MAILLAVIVVMMGMTYENMYITHKIFISLALTLSLAFGWWIYQIVTHPMNVFQKSGLSYLLATCIAIPISFVAPFLFTRTAQRWIQWMILGFVVVIAWLGFLTTHITFVAISLMNSPFALTFADYAVAVLTCMAGGDMTDGQRRTLHQNVTKFGTAMAHTKDLMQDVYSEAHKEQKISLKMVHQSIHFKKLMEDIQEATADQKHRKTLSTIHDLTTTALKIKGCSSAADVKSGLRTLLQDLDTYAETQGMKNNYDVVRANHEFLKFESDEEIVEGIPPDILASKVDPILQPIMRVVEELQVDGADVTHLESQLEDIRDGLNLNQELATLVNPAHVAKIMEQLAGPKSASATELIRKASDKLKHDNNCENLLSPIDDLIKSKHLQVAKMVGHRNSMALQRSVDLIKGAIHADAKEETMEGLTKETTRMIHDILEQSQMLGDVDGPDIPLKEKDILPVVRHFEIAMASVMKTGKLPENFIDELEDHMQPEAMIASVSQFSTTMFNHHQSEGIGVYFMKRITKNSWIDSDQRALILRHVDSLLVNIKTMSIDMEKVDKLRNILIEQNMNREAIYLDIAANIFEAAENTRNSISNLKPKDIQIPTTSQLNSNSSSRSTSLSPHFTVPERVDETLMSKLYADLRKEMDDTIPSLSIHVTEYGDSVHEAILDKYSSIGTNALQSPDIGNARRFWNLDEEVAKSLIGTARNIPHKRSAGETLVE